MSTYRPDCGTWRGFRTHVTRGEQPCDWCVHAGAVAALEAERIRPVPRMPPRHPFTLDRTLGHAAHLAKVDDTTADPPPSQRGAA